MVTANNNAGHVLSCACYCQEHDAQHLYTFVSLLAISLLHEY
jgi:hypothetical protein